MVSSRLRSVGFVTILAVVSMLAMVLAWTAQAESAPQTQAASKSGVANLQLLGVNAFHGNLEPIANPSYRTPTGNVEGTITCGGAEDHQARIATDDFTSTQRARRVARPLSCAACGRFNSDFRES